MSPSQAPIPATVTISTVPGAVLNVPYTRFHLIPTATVIQKILLYFTDEETKPVMGVEANNNTWYLQHHLLLACLPQWEPS